MKTNKSTCIGQYAGLEYFSVIGGEFFGYDLYYIFR